MVEVISYKTFFWNFKAIVFCFFLEKPLILRTKRHSIFLAYKFNQAVALRLNIRTLSHVVISASNMIRTRISVTRHYIWNFLFLQTRAMFLEQKLTCLHLTAKNYPTFFHHVSQNQYPIPNPLHHHGVGVLTLLFSLQSPKSILLKNKVQYKLIPIISVVI